MSEHAPEQDVSEKPRTAADQVRNPTETDHPAGEEQAARNTAEELPG